MHKKICTLAPILTLVVTIMAMTTKLDEETNSIFVDARKPTEQILPNIASNINVWQMGGTFANPIIEFPEYNEFKFVKWVQLMMCSGGSETRDLFKGPNDRTTLTDYNFDLLIKNCEGILKLGGYFLLSLRLSSRPVNIY